MPLDRRRFLALTALSGATAAVTRNADAAASPWRSAAWTARIGRTITATDSAGRRHDLHVDGVEISDQQPGTTGECFTVGFGTHGALADGRYRLRGAGLSTTVHLGAAGRDHATLVVNSMRPTAVAR